MIPLATINQYASQISGTPVTLSCDAPSTFDTGELGYVNFVIDADGNVLAVIPTIHLPTPTCQRLQHADTGPLEPSDFLTAVHEAIHIQTASRNECQVEQTALANIWPFLRLFKLAARRTRAILAGAIEADRNLPDEYHADAAGVC